jgi:aspartate/methionine/tyrosine aminotransferase
MDVLAKRTWARFNLAAGEPKVISTALNNSGTFDTDYQTYEQYPDIGGDTKLQEAVAQFCKTNRLVDQPGYYVITNGAKQALGAALYALRHQLRGRVLHWGPYWPTLKSICELAHVSLNTTELESAAQIVTSPNNPDGRLSRGGSCLIWDAAYASPAFGWLGIIPKHKISVFSMAKLFGVPGLRVGWLFTTDEKLARDAAAYVEVQTSGVNTYAQAEAERLLLHFADPRIEYLHFTSNVQLRLAGARAAFTNVLYSYIEDIGAPGGGGMYLWCQSKPGYHRKFKRALQACDVAHVTGLQCGVFTPYTYRFNLAADYLVVKNAARAIKQEMYKQWTTKRNEYTST